MTDFKPVEQKYDIDREVDNLQDAVSRQHDAIAFLKGHIDSSLELYCKLKGREASYKYLSLDGIDPKCNEMSFSGDEYWRYGGHEFHSLDMPLSFLRPEEQLRYIQKHNAELQVKKEKLAARVAAQALAAEKADREEYDRLQARYGTE